MKIPFFISGLLIGIACTLIWWPEEIQSLQPSGGIDNSSSRVASERASVAELMAACRAATSNREIYDARNALGNLSSGQIEDALNLVSNDGPHYKWTSEARCLVVHWARRDPESALAWAWENLRDSGRWDIASAEIFETWIASGDPAVIAFLNGIDKSEEPLRAERAKDEQPLTLNGDQMRKIKEWLFFYDENLARSALESGIKMAWRSPPPVRFYDRLESAIEMEAVLKRWEGVENGTMMQAGIRQRGRELGMDFSGQSKIGSLTRTQKRTGADWSKSLTFFWNGARTDLAESLEKAAALEPKARHNAYLVLYDSWSLANADKEADFESLPEEAREIWKDLSGLGPVADDHHMGFIHKK